VGGVAHEAKGSEGSTGQRGEEGLPWGSGGTARERGSIPAKMGRDVGGRGYREGARSGLRSEAGET